MRKHRYTVRIQDDYVADILGCKITQNKERAAIMTWSDARTTVAMFKEAGNKHASICRADGTPVGVYESVSLLTLLLVAIAAAPYLKIILENIQ